MPHPFEKGHFTPYRDNCPDLYWSHTAKIYSGSTGFSLCTNPTALSLHFLQTNNANIECKNCKKIFTVGCL